MKRQNFAAGLPMISKLAIFTCASLTGVAAYGQAVVDSSLPPYNLAPYVLERNSVEVTPRYLEGGTKAYRPWFEPGAWTGDLIQYYIDETGQRAFRADVGRFPRDRADWRGEVHPDPWSARYAFPDFTPYSLGEESDPELPWCIPEEPDYWMSRNIITLSGNNTIDFFWHELTPGQQAAIDSGLAAEEGNEEDAYASELLNYIRGKRTFERCAGGDFFRTRFSLLGAVINSRPVYVPPAGQRGGLVVVGANAGMLHGFSAADGTEVFAYVPSMILDRLNLVGSDFFRTYFVDGELRHENIGTEQDPRNIIAGGLGAGGKGLFVLDVTNQSSPEVLHELSGTNSPFIGGTYHPQVGNVFGRPVVARLPESPRYQAGWYVIAGNGYDSVAGRAELVIIPVNGTQPIFIDTEDPVPTPGAPRNGLAAPVLVDTTGNGVADVAYAGDLRGRLLRFDLRTATSRVLFDAGTSRPITVEPDVARHPSLDGYMVYFGTGRLMNAADSETTTRQGVYGIWDRNDGLTVEEGSLVIQTLEELPYTWDVPQEQNSCVDPPGAQSQSTVRFVPNQQPVIWTSALGWQVELPRDGERLVRPARIRADRLQFTTTNPVDMRAADPNADPNQETASPAGSWMMQLDLETGASPALALRRRALFDLNKNCMLDQQDSVEITAGPNPGSYFPIGLNLGASNIAQPEFARVRFDQSSGSVVDGVYINALRFPSPAIASPGLVGPIDVMTDVPNGGAPLWHEYLPEDPDFPGRDGLYPEPAKLDFDTDPLRQFEDASSPIKPFIAADGVGNRVDGHASGYNLIHGVNYVDIIRLEPRRGEFRLDVGTAFEDVVGADPRIKPINPRRAQQELYRATEAVPMDQKFIVMLANADLSPYSDIQIGCRIWPVYEYQTMMMQRLRSGANAMVGRGDSLEALVDANNESLIVSLSEFFQTGPGGAPVQRTCSVRPVGSPDDHMTIRIIPRFPTGMMNALQWTLPGCVNNTHRYDGSPKTGALASMNPTRTQLYSIDPHVTANDEGAGYRWRNGALVVQLLRVDSSNTADFLLQNRGDLPEGVRQQGQSPVEGVNRGFGGAYAAGFGENNLTPYTGPENGLLYEATMFWHWGDLARNRSRGGGQSVSPACYGGPPNINNAVLRWEDLYSGPPGSDENFVLRYEALVDGFSEEDQRNYAIWMNNLLTGTDVENSILRLQELFTQQTGVHANTQFNLGDYHRLRHYILASRRVQDSLIPLDRGITIDLQDAGTPVNVLDIERDLLPSLGPNYQPGRRSWIDLTPDE